jgi:hypothetical protein
MVEQDGGRRTQMKQKGTTLAASITSTRTPESRERKVVELVSDSLRAKQWSVKNVE